MAKIRHAFIPCSSAIRLCSIPILRGLLIRFSFSSFISLVQDEIQGSRTTLSHLRDSPPRKTESVFSRLAQGSGIRPATSSNNNNKVTSTTDQVKMRQKMSLSFSQKINPLIWQPKRRSLFGDSTRDSFTKTLTKKFESPAKRPEENGTGSLKRSTSIRTADRPRSSFFSPMPEQPAPERTMTLGRSSSFRTGTRTPGAGSSTPSSSTVDKKTASGYTSSLMNWRPFRKSRDETNVEPTPSRKSSTTSTISNRPIGASTRSSNLGTSNSSLKRSTSSVSSLTPLRVGFLIQRFATSQSIDCFPQSINRAVVTYHQTLIHRALKGTAHQVHP